MKITFENTEFELDDAGKFEYAGVTYQDNRVAELGFFSHAVVQDEVSRLGIDQYLKMITMEMG